MVWKNLVSVYINNKHPYNKFTEILNTHTHIEFLLYKIQLYVGQFNLDIIITCIVVLYVCNREYNPSINSLHN